VTSLALALHERSLCDGELSVFATFERPLFRAPQATSDIPHVIEEMGHLRSRGGRRLGWKAGGASALNRAAQACDADVVHALDPFAVTAPRLDFPRVVTCHHLESKVDAAKWHGGNAQFSRSERARYTRADRVIAISRATAQELIARLDVPRERISVVYNGVSDRAWSSTPQGDDGVQRKALGVGRGAYLLCVGAVDARKNFEGILSGLARARQLTEKSELRIIWVGRLSPKERSRLDSEARKLGLSEAIHFVGYVTDPALAALYRGASALVFASKREGFGYPVVEAMACSCPVITSNCSSLIEVAGDAALTLDPEDQSAIADAMVLLSDDNAERQSLGERGRKRAGEFTLSSMVDGTLQAYRGALDGPPPARPSHPPSA